MKRASTGAALILAATMAGCATTPVNYATGLSQQDPKWQTPQCEQVRTKALDYEAREKKNPGWASGVLLGPYGLGLVAAIKEHQQKQRKLLAREMHMQCSSLPLPNDLQVDPNSQNANRTKYP